jgi:D-alanyl-D-alanine-carboxypeptidase/D-alanyl-D-alanine-endopeptidase
MSYVAFAPGRDVGVFVSVNKIDFAMFSSGLSATFDAHAWRQR